MPGPYASIDSLPLFDSALQSITVRATAYRDNGSNVPTPIDGFIGVPIKVNSASLAGVKQALQLFATLAANATAADIASAAQNVTIFGLTESW